MDEQGNLDLLTQFANGAIEYFRCHHVVRVLIKNRKEYCLYFLVENADLNHLAHDVMFLSCTSTKRRQNNSNLSDCLEEECPPSFTLVY